MTTAFTVGEFTRFNRNSLYSCPSDVQLLCDPLTSQVVMLWRSQYESLRNTLDSIYDTKQPRMYSDDKVFNGPAGTGKSCLVYGLVQYALQKGFIVFYVSDCERLTKLSDKDLAVELLQNISSTNTNNWPGHFPSLAITGLSSEEVICRAKKAVGALKISALIPCMIAVDQWNVVRDCRKGSLFEEIFGSFDRLRVTKGACYLEVSSSFSFPFELFHGADAITHRITVKLYDNTELSTVANYMRQTNHLPMVGYGFDEEQINKFCGRVEC